MKWKYYPLADSSLRARAHVLKNLSVGAAEHCLTKKLLKQFRDATGAIIAIAFESLDVDTEHFVANPTYGGGKRTIDESVAWADAPIWGLVKFVDRWLQQSADAAVISENFFATRQSVTLHPRESRTAFYGDQVYHILSNADAGQEPLIECALRESEHHLGAGVCTLCKTLPQTEIKSEDFFDEIVGHTAHIFTPAFDNAGYLVWSPGAAQTGEETTYQGTQLV